MARGRKFVVKNNAKGEPMFELVASNGRILMWSEGYSNNHEMMDTLNTLLGKKLPTKVVDERT